MSRNSLSDLDELLRDFQSARTDFERAHVWLYVRRIKDKTAVPRHYFFPPLIPPDRPPCVQGWKTFGPCVSRSSGFRAIYQCVFDQGEHHEAAKDRFWELSENAGRILKLEPIDVPPLAWVALIHRRLETTYWATSGLDDWRYDPFDASIVCLRQLAEEQPPQPVAHDKPQGIKPGRAFLLVDQIEGEETTRIFDAVAPLADPRALFNPLRTGPPDVLAIPNQMLQDAIDSAFAQGDQPIAEQESHPVVERGRDQMSQSAETTMEELPKAPGGGMSWRNAKHEAEQIRLNGDPFTSYPKMAKRIGCSRSTLHKAIVTFGTVELQDWASKQRGASRLNAPPEVAAVAIENTPQGREPDPAGIIEDADIDNTLTYLMDEADPNERARINAMDAAQKRRLVELVLRDPDLEEQALRSRKAGRSRRD